MPTRTWNGANADWNTDADWLPAIPNDGVPNPGDTVIITSGTVILTTDNGASDGLFEDNTVQLGGSSGAGLLLRNTRAIGRYFNVSITGNATIEADGERGIAASITGAPNDGSTITLKADPGGSLVLLHGGSFNVSDREIDFVGTIVLERSAMVSGNIVNNGTLSILSGTTTFATNSLTGTGTIAIGSNAQFSVSGNQFAGSSQTITFAGTGGTLSLFYNTPGNYSGAIKDFAPGDFIEFLPGSGTTTSAVVDTTAHKLTISDSGGDTYVINNFYGAAGTLTTTHESNGRDLIGYASAEPRLDYEIDAGARAMHADVVQQMTLPDTTTPITGAGVKIGIISNSFNVQGKAAADIANGYLPAAGVTVLREGSSGEDDEGRAMAELIYQSAPGASLCFASTGSGVDDFAASVQALQAAGCTIIVDDISLFNSEPFFQLGSPAENAIAAAMAAGVTYVSSAGNFGDAFYEHAFATTQQTLYDGSSVQAMTFSNGSPYQSITALGGTYDTIDLQWDAPFYGSGGTASDQPDSIVFKVFNATNNALVGTSTQVSVDGHLVAEAELTLPGSSSNKDYYLAIYHADGTPVVSEIKYIISGVSTGTGLGGRINDPDAGVGSGTIAGHQLIPGVIAVGAADVTNTAAFGNTPDFMEYFSSAGGASLLFDANGNRYAQPVVSGSPDVVGPDGVDTSVDGFTPFYGTSAAAPNVAAVIALMLQANPSLTSTQIASFLAQSAIDLGLPSANQGAGLVQADRAVALAEAASGSQQGPVTVAYFQANQAQLDQQSGGFSIADTAANIAAGIGSLQADQAHINAITPSDGNTVAVGLGKFVADQAALNKVAGGFAIVGQASAIQSNIDALEADIGHITSITAQTGTVTFGIGKFTPNQAALNKVVGGFAINGQASAIQANLGALAADANHITSITAQNGTVTVSVADFQADRAVLDKIVGGFAIVDSGANIAAGIAALQADQANVTAITSSDATVAVGIGKFVPNQAALNKVTGGFAIVGQASAIQSNIDALEADIGHITSITAQTGTVTFGVGKFTPNEAALNKVVGGFAINGQSGAISANFDALAADTSHIVSLAFADDDAGAEPDSGAGLGRCKLDRQDRDTLCRACRRRRRHHDDDGPRLRPDHPRGGGRA